MATDKKVTRVEGGSSSSESTTTRTPFVPTEDAKGRATQLRIFATLAWVGAIAAQIGAIWFVLKNQANPNFMAWVIGLIVVDLIFAVVGSYLWKKSNRLDPASKQDSILFFLQSQLGLVTAIVAFLPLVIVILTNKNLSGKQKGILGGIAGVALLIAGVAGTDFNPPSVEEYTEQTARVEELNNGNNLVYWTKSGTKYHLYDDCHAINKDVTTEIFSGTVAQARELKNISELCKFCENKAEKANTSGGEAASESPLPESSSSDEAITTESEDVSREATETND